MPPEFEDMDWNSLSGHKKYPIDIETIKEQAFNENPMVIEAYEKRIKLEEKERLEKLVSQSVTPLSTS